MTLNYQRIVVRYPKSKGVVGGLIPGCKVYFVLDGKSKLNIPISECGKSVETRLNFFRL
jgi:hypothetical protein